MGKMKIYELAKQMNIESKKIVDIANKNGIEVKSYLSNIDDEDVEKIKKILISGDSKLKNSNEVKKPAKKNIKENEAPVIIRREVIINDYENKEKNEAKKKSNQNHEVGFVNHNDRKKDFNIVYRNKPSKPLTMNELFGLNKTEKKNDDNKSNEIKKETEINKKEDEEVKEIKQEKAEVLAEKNISQDSENNKIERSPYKNGYNNMNSNYNNNAYNRNNNFKNNNRNNYQGNSNSYQNNMNNNYNNRRNNFNNNDNDNSNVFSNRNNYYNNKNNYSERKPGENNGFNRNFRNREGNENRPEYNRNNRFNNTPNSSGENANNRNNGFKNNRNNNYNNNQNGYQKRDKDNFARNNDSKLKNVFEIEITEKENVRDFANKSRDKQKQNQKLNMQKQPKKNRKSSEGSFDVDKLKGLKKHNNFNDDEMLDYYDLTTERGRRGKKKNDKQEERIKQKIFKLTDIVIPENIMVKDLASEMKITSSDVIKKLMDLGIMTSINNMIDFDTAYLVAQEFGINATKKNIVTDEDILIDESEDNEEDLVSRPPVIVVMGHVDHGKTSLLDAIRKTNVIEGESGGITQHIGAYQVEIDGRQITFLDTPGHEAFTSMRARGAMITDIAILVVAANDGVMPQTVEAINHAKAAGIPIIVAVNKIDLPDSNIEKVKQELMKYELVPEEWGGNTIYVPISAKQNIGIDVLLEMVLLQADVLELKANPKKQAKGTIIEARLDKTKGPIATMLVQRGKLDVGDTIIVGSSIGRIRTMKNDQGRSVKFAGPSMPVEITGLHSVPETGETFYEVEDEKTAKHLIEKRKYEERQKTILHATTAVTLDDLFNKIENENLKSLNLIVKADVQGSVEALTQSLEKLSNDEVRVKVIHSNVGGVTETDVTLAQVSDAIIIAFNVRPGIIAANIAEKENVQIKTYSIIYDAINDVEAAMKGLLDPIYKEVVVGSAEVRQIFKVSNVGTIAGCYVLNGKVSRNAGIRVIRNDIVIHDGKLISLKRFKDDAKEVDKGYECGLQIENYNDLLEGDKLEVYIMEEVKR